jgi:hypothetical protein
VGTCSKRPYSVCSTGPCISTERAPGGHRIERLRGRARQAEDGHESPPPTAGCHAEGYFCNSWRTPSK